ncbi:PadR family transcriptional regulator [Lachnoclostridium phytofermentans]|uniref:Transcriptional regulator, PadR-like family n=1 Tax=Lachnoclostridium phytofermentans (strain ATCC 700394 / DSM 18823 / ISDg) TaxID=357809 RepID=A9KMD3_LACP7|nr:PadR family transcriptional regulator [Lachnoclostridium phytofermentans]ABX42887.1 transcriptional regulator, PadR-like family [Lachnoclostridium phytofermentans ISDg]
MLESIILGMVLEEDLTGYDIKKRIETGIGVFYKASFGSLYPALKKMTGKGCLIAYDKSQGGRQKIFYQITEAGKKSFYDWLSSPMNIFDGTNTHLAKVYFFDRLSPELREHQLLQHEINNVNYLHKLEALEKEFDKLEHKECFYYKLSTLYYGICITREAIRWCQSVRKQQPLSELMRKGADL